MRKLFSLGLLFFSLSLYAEEKLSLNNAIHFALQHNPEILAAQKEIEASNGRILQAGKILNPELEIAWNEVPTVFGFGKANERDIGISQQVEYPSKRRNRIDIAEVGKELLQLKYERAKTFLTSRIKIAYFQFLYAQELVTYLERQKILLNDMLQNITVKYQSGMSSYLDVLRMKVEITRTGNELLEAKREVKIQQTQFNFLLSKETNDEIFFLDSLVFAPIVFKAEEKITSLAESSLTLKIARLSIEREKKLLTLANTSYYPDFAFGLSAQQREEIGNLKNNYFGISFNVSVPLWFWQEPRGQVQEATALVEIADYNLSSQQRNIKTNIINTIQTVQTIETQLNIFNTTLRNDIQNILETGMSQYGQNQIDLLNLLDIYRTSRTSEIEWKRAIMNYNIALSELEIANELLPND